MIWQPSKDKNDLWEIWGPGKRLYNPGAVQDQGEPFEEDRLKNRHLTPQLWSLLQKGKQLHIPDDLATAPLGFLMCHQQHTPSDPGGVTSTHTVGNRHRYLGPGHGP